MKKVIFITVAILVLSLAFCTQAFANEYKLDEKGTLYGKGDNEYGQLGMEPQMEENRYGGMEYVKIEEFVPILDNVKSYLGYSTVYAIREDNSLWTWGENTYGQCGVGHTENVYEPVKILDNIKMVKTTTKGALAVGENGELYSWGLNSAWMGMASAGGVLGVGDTEELTLSPVKVLEDVKEVYADSITFATMAVKNNGELWVTGMGDANPNREECYVFTKVEGIEKVKKVDLTTFNVRVDTYDGDVYFFGDITDWGGAGSFPLRRVKEFKTPVKVMEKVEKAVGHSDIFGLKADGTLWYWGEDTNYKDANPIMDKVKDISSLNYFLKEDGTLLKYDGKSYENEALTNVDCFLDDETVQRKDKTKWTLKNSVRRIVEEGEIRILIDTKYLNTDVAPYIKNGRTMVPMRAIFEALGALVTWDNETKTAVAVRGGVEIKITIGENVLYKNGEEINLDAPAEITNDRTMVPVRAIGEAFSYIVEWDNETKEVKIVDESKRTYYEYDDKGQIVLAKSSDGNVIINYEYLYDENGNVVRVWEKSMIKNSDRLFQYTYNDKGQRVEKRVCTDWWMYAIYGGPIDRPVIFTEVEKYMYDDEGQLWYADSPSGLKRFYVYNEEGKLVGEENQNGEVIKKYFYHEDGRINYTESY